MLRRMLLIFSPFKWWSVVSVRFVYRQKIHLNIINDITQQRKIIMFRWKLGTKLQSIWPHLTCVNLRMSIVLTSIFPQYPLGITNLIWAPPGSFCNFPARVKPNSRSGNERIRHCMKKVITYYCRARWDLSENTMSSRYDEWLWCWEFSEFWWFTSKLWMNYLTWGEKSASRRSL